MEPNGPYHGNDPKDSYRKTLILAVLFFVAVVVLVGVWSFRSTGKTAQGADWVPGTTPGPWQFDKAGNRHWNPQPGHDHWHNGPPPAESDRNLVQPAAPISMAPSQSFKPSLQTQDLPKDPKPWQYDKASNQHYDPRPGHQHWHQGQPPPDEQRK